MCVSEAGTWKICVFCLSSQSRGKAYLSLKHNFAKQELQVTVKLASLELIPTKPKYDGGWIMAYRRPAELNTYAQAPCNSTILILTPKCYFAFPPASG